MWEPYINPISDLKKWPARFYLPIHTPGYCDFKSTMLSLWDGDDTAYAPAIKNDPLLFRISGHYDSTNFKMFIDRKKKTAQQVADRLNGATKTDTEKPSSIFPLIPEYGTRPGGQHNTKSWWFNWLIFRLWSMDSFNFEVTFVISEHWGIGFVGMLPYVRWVACIPCPPKLGSYIQQKLWRKA